MNNGKVNKTKEKTQNIAVSSLVCALCFVAMYFGTITGVLDLCAATLSALLIIYTVIEIGGIYPWLIWGVTGTLCLILLPDKYIALEFVLYGGIYPMIKAYAERLPKILAWCAKLVYFNIAFIGSVYIAKYVFITTDIGFTFKYTAIAAANVFFILSDVCFTLLISVYMVKLRPRFKLKKSK